MGNTNPNLSQLHPILAYSSWNPFSLHYTPRSLVQDVCVPKWDWIISWTEHDKCMYITRDLHQPWNDWNPRTNPTPGKCYPGVRSILKAIILHSPPAQHMPMLLPHRATPRPRSNYGKLLTLLQRLMVSLLHLALLEAIVADLNNYTRACSPGIADPVSSTAPPMARPEILSFFCISSW